MEGRVPGGHKKSISGDDKPFDEHEQQVNNHSQCVKGSENVPLRGHGLGDTTVDNTVNSDLVNFEKDKTHSNYHSSPLEILVRGFKKMTHFGAASSSASSKKQSKTLGRSKSLKRENAKAPLPQNQSLFGKQIYFESDKVPGLVGIKNHGNTCFMNAVLQCLSNTELLTQYFITDHYKQDMRGKSKQNAKKYGTKGELTQHIARLLKSLWTQQYTPTVSSDLKAIVGKYGPQYRGTLQHDAQEFLLWLLDKIHEDLNIAQKKKYKSPKSIYGRSDEAVSAEALANLARCNNSYVYDLFQALYKSSLTCPKCHQQSNTFDPFLCVSLPIPQRNSKPLYVTVVYMDAHPKQVRIGLLMEPSDTVRQLREALACDTNIPQEQLILTEIYYDGFHRTFHDSQPLSDLTHQDNIYAIEVPAVHENIGLDKTSAGASIVLVLLNKPSLPQGRRFGGPFVLTVSREASFSQLQAQILDSMSAMLTEGVTEQVDQSGEVLFSLRVLEGLVEKGQRCLLPNNVEHPLFMPEVDRALQACTPEWGPEHVKVIIEWDDNIKQRVIANSTDHVEEHSSVKQVMQQNHKPVTASLVECLQTYTKEERLECDTAWYCPNCRSQQHGTTKAISLWSTPDVFVIHLKRFKQTSVNRSKLETLITFPLTNLEMSKHIAKRPSSGQSVNKEMTGWSPWRPNRKSPTTEADYIYDLYGVVNHYGNMQGGHYTAFCKSAATNRWYSFDDTKVTEMNEKDVVSYSAYLLFYQRRTANSCTIYHPDHWLHQVARIRFTDAPKRQSQSQEDLVEDTKHDCVDPVVRNSNPYATMRSAFYKVSVKPATTPSSDVFPPIAGSPSMGSLGHVVVCAEPGREVRAHSQGGGESPAASPQHADPFHFSDSAARHENEGVNRSRTASMLLPQNGEQQLSLENAPNGEVAVGVLVDIGSTSQDTSMLKHSNQAQEAKTKKHKAKEPRAEETVTQLSYNKRQETQNGEVILHESDTQPHSEMPDDHVHAESTPSHPNNLPEPYQQRVRTLSQSSNKSPSSSTQRKRHNSQNNSPNVAGRQRVRNSSQESNPNANNVLRTRTDSQNSGMYSPPQIRDDARFFHQSPPQVRSASPKYNPHFTHIYIEDSVHGVVSRQITPKARTPAFSPPTPPRYANSMGLSVSGSTSGSSYDNVSVENHLNEQKLVAMLASSSVQGTPRTRVKRPQQHVTSLPKEIKSPDDRRADHAVAREGVTKELQQRDYKQTVYLQESCV